MAVSFETSCPSGLEHSYLGYDCYAGIDKEISGIRSPPLFIGGVSMMVAGAYLWTQAGKISASSRRIAPYVATKWDRSSRQAIAGLRLKL